MRLHLRISDDAAKAEDQKSAPSNRDRTKGVDRTAILAYEYAYLYLVEF